MNRLRRWPFTSWTICAVAPLYLAAAMALAGPPPVVVLVPPRSAEPRAFPVPDAHPTCRIADIRIKDGDTIRCRRLLDAGVSQEIDVRLAPTEGRFNAADKEPRKSLAAARLQSLLTGGPFYARLTGERSFERWVGQVFRQTTVEVATPNGIVYEPRIENVADVMVSEGLGVAKGE